MKVMQVMAGARHGGAEAFFERLVCALHEDGLEQKVAIRTNAARAAVLRSAGIEPVEFPFGGPLDLMTPRALRRVIDAYRPDVVLSWMNRATAAVTRARRGAKHRFFQAARLGGYYNLKYYRGCDYLVGNTPGVVDYLIREGWPAARTRVLPNFVTTEHLPAAPRDAHETPADVPLVLALGRLHRVKAFDVLIDAMAEVPGAYLWLGGDGPERASLERRVAELGIADRVRFLGWREDAPALFAACDLFVCPSRYEPLGNVILEAWAQGRPIVASRSDGPVMLIEPGRTGVLVPIDDPPAMGEAIRDTLADEALRRRMAEAGVVEYEARFTREKVVEQYRAFFASVTQTEDA